MTTTLLNNRYQIIQVLGAGGFGETFLAEDTYMPSRRRCVIKQLKPVSGDPRTYEMIKQKFEREAATLEYLGEGHEQIPKLYAYFSEQGQFYLVQEWIQGHTLFDIVAAKGPVEEKTVREILLSLLPVLNYVHTKGIIHRDIKPDNIILRTSSSPTPVVGGKPVLIDFGAVKETIRSVVNSQGETTKSLVIGTPGYMPLEQGLGRPVYATDLYSLGLTAIFLLTGKSPQELETNPQTGEIVWQNYVPGISSNLGTVLEKAIKSQVGDRYSTASQMLHALQSASSTPQPQTPYPATQPTIPLSPGGGGSTSTQGTKPLSSGQKSASIPTPSKFDKWHQRPWIISILVAGGLIGGITIASIFSRQPQPEIVNTTSTPGESTEETSDTNPVASPSASPNSQPRVNSPVVSQSSPPPIPPAPRENSSPSSVSSPKVESTVQPETNPVVTTTQTPVATPSQPKTTNQETTTAPPTEENSPPETKQPAEKKQKKDQKSDDSTVATTSNQTVPTFPAGTSRSSVEAVLGKPVKDLRGVWRNTRAVIYKPIPNKVDLGYLFDTNSGVLRQTEAGFRESVDLQLMQTTLNGMLDGKATQEIQQGLQQIQQRQSNHYKFRIDDWKGQIVRQNCGDIYISIWESDLHDFINPAKINKC
ncbi:MAG: protein kinase [Nostocaceae cyanobacterium]|nr:protein kinase [Nostocaceae cyanobacterium]